MNWNLEPFLRPEWLDGRDIWCIGCGALGSRYIKRLVQAGAPRIHVMDDDYIEPRNVANTEDFARFIGKKKIDAMQQIVREMRPHQDILIPHDERATPETKLTGFVLLGLDSLAERRRVVEHCIRGNTQIAFVVDGRMGATGGRAYGIDPNNLMHIERYFTEEHLSSDSPEELGGCVQTPAAAPTADMVAGETLWRLGRWLHLEQGCTDPYINYVGFELVPSNFYKVESW